MDVSRALACALLTKPVAIGLIALLLLVLMLMLPAAAVGESALENSTVESPLLNMAQV